MKKTVIAIAITFALGVSAVPLHAQNRETTEHACDVAEEYVKLINNGKYDAVGGVFADDAVYMGPDGKTRHGAKRIGAFYSRFLPIFKPQLRASKFFAQGNDCVMELENKDQSGEFTPVAVDHFTVDAAGKVSKFIVYLRPGAEGTRSLRSALSKVRGAREDAP